MDKAQLITKLKEQRMVVVVRGGNQSDGIKTATAAIKGGITAIEVAYTNPQASDIISTLNKQYHENEDVLIGAGTVLDAITARQAILSGAKYIVSPSFSSEVAEVCHLYAIVYIPGCMTPTEITTALKAGCEMIKLFPGSVFTPAYISSLKAPLPQVMIMVTGGISLETAGAWFAAGADAIGIGGEFNKLATQGNFTTITEIARQYRDLCQ